MYTLSDNGSVQTHTKNTLTQKRTQTQYMYMYSLTYLMDALNNYRLKRRSALFTPNKRGD